MSTLTRKLTIDEFFRQAPTLGRCELIEGEVRTTSPAGSNHGMIAGRLCAYISMYVIEKDLGIPLAAETGFIVDAEHNTVRAPDFAFIAREHAAAAKTAKFCPVAPDMCAEVLSPEDRASDVITKVRMWFDFGVRSVWVVDPQSQSVTVHHADGNASIFQVSDEITEPVVLPAFRLQVAKLFA